MFDEEHQTDEIIMDALAEIARKDNIGIEKLWQDGYTKIHNAEDVEVMVKKYIRENVKPEEIEEYYNWGIEKIWMNSDEVKPRSKFKGRGKTEKPSCPKCGKDMRRSYEYEWTPSVKKGKYIANGWECKTCKFKQWD